MEGETGDDRICHSRPSPRSSAQTVVHARKDLLAAENSYFLHTKKKDQAIDELADNTDERGLKLLRFMQCAMDDESAQGKSTVKGIKGCELDKVLSEGKLIAPASRTSC